MQLHRQLFSRLEQLKIRYPISNSGEQLVIPVPGGDAKRIQGRAFFPGGSGTSEGENYNLPDNPILVLGNNFGSYNYYNDCVHFHKEEPLTNSTWNQLLDIYQESGINPKICFHTNVFMGFIPGTKNSDPMTLNSHFIDDCYAFLVSQIKIVNPRAIIAVGAKAKDALSSVSHHKIPSWWDTTYVDLYQTGHFFHKGIDLRTTELGWQGDLLTMTHPSLRKGNFGKIRKNSGFDPEPIELHGLSELATRNA